MTVESNDTQERSVIAGVGPYEFSFRIFDETDISVAVDTGDVDGTVLVLTTHYSVSGVNDEDGGSITLTPEIATLYAGDTIDIRSNVPASQPASFRNLGRFLNTSHEAAFDRMARQIQDLERKLGRAVRLPDFALADGEMTPLSSYLSRYLFVSDEGTLEPALLLNEALTQPSFDQFLNGAPPFVRTAAEIAKTVFPVTIYRNPGDLRRYGAVGDGTTDCTAAWQAAINQADHATGNEVFIPQGSWRITSALTGARGVKFVGEGRQRSIVVVEGAINFLTFTGALGNPDGGAMVFRDFTIEGSPTSGNLIELNTAGQCEFHGMRFWKCGATSGGMVVLAGECHRVTFENCLFQSWAYAAVLTDNLNSIVAIKNCQFNTLGADLVSQVAGSACLSLGTGEEIFINGCNVNGGDTLNHFVRITDSGGNIRIGECYTEGLTGSAILTDTSIVLDGIIVENCNLSCANSVSIDFSAGNPAHYGIHVRNIRRPESGAVFVLNPGTGVIDFSYSGTLLDTSADHVVGYTGASVRAFPQVRKFGDGTHYLGSRVRHVVGPFTQDNVAGTVGATAMSGVRFIAPRAGRVTGVVVKSTEARTAGTLSVNVFKNTGLSGAAGSVLADSPSADLDGTNTSKDTGYTQDHDASFEAGDELYATYQTSGFTPTTADIRAFIEIEM